MKKNIIYDVEFSQLEEEILGDLEDNTQTLNKLHIELLGVIDKKQQTLKQILSLKEGDLIKLDKQIEKYIDIYVSDIEILSGKIVEIDNTKFLEILNV